MNDNSSNISGAAPDTAFLSHDKMQYSMVVADTMCFLPGLCLDWCPDGFFFRNEYMSNHPDHEGETHSLCINLQTGRWTDIAANAQGYEPVSYYAHLNNISPEDALEILIVEMELETFLGRPPRVLM